MPNNKKGKKKSKNIATKSKSTQIKKSDLIKSIDYEVLEGKGIKLLYPYLDRDKLPPVSIITPTRNRRSVFELTIYQFLNFDYPRDKIQWVILDNGTDKIKDLLPLEGNNIKYMTLSGDKRYNLGDLRNHCIKHCDNDIIVYMDDDDYYPKETIYSRVMALIKYYKEGVECVGTVTGMGYNIITGDVQVMSNGDQYLMEASLCHTKKFWNDRSFKKTNVAAEYEYFLKGRHNKIRKIPFQFVCVPFNHKINCTDRGNRHIKNYNGKSVTVARLNKNEDIKNNGTTRNNIFVNKIFSKEIIAILERVKYIQLKDEFEKNIKDINKEKIIIDESIVIDSKNKNITDKDENKIVSGYKIGFIIPVTSNNREWKNIDEIYLKKFVLQSLVISSKEEIVKNKLVFYIGIDRDDKIYDNLEIQKQFQEYINSDILEFKFIYLDNIEKGYLTKMWNKLFKIAYDDDCDYFFQCGDDVEFQTNNWISDCIITLKKMNNNGLTGPRNEHPTLLTQSFVSRKHMDKFSKYFSEEIKNWFCDDWINEIYKRMKQYKPLENHKCINMGGDPRYEIDNNSNFSENFDKNMELMRKKCMKIVEEDFNNVL